MARIAATPEMSRRTNVLIAVAVGIITRGGTSQTFARSSHSEGRHLANVDTPEGIRRECKRLIALYLTAHPEHLDLPIDVVRRAVAEHVLARAHAGEYRQSVPRPLPASPPR